MTWHQQAKAEGWHSDTECSELRAKDIGTIVAHGKKIDSLEASEKTFVAKLAEKSDRIAELKAQLAKMAETISTQDEMLLSLNASSDAPKGQGEEVKLDGVETPHPPNQAKPPQSREFHAFLTGGLNGDYSRIWRAILQKYEATHQQAQPREWSEEDVKSLADWLGENVASYNSITCFDGSILTAGHGLDKIRATQAIEYIKSQLSRRNGKVKENKEVD